MALVEKNLPKRFKPLFKYFRGVTYTDLAYLSEEDLVAGVTPEEKLLMIVLIREHLLEHLDKPNPFLAREFDPAVVGPTLRVDDSGVLNLRQAVISSRFFNVRTVLIPVKELWSRIKSDFGDPGTVKQIILASNNLMDEDMTYIADLIKQLSQCAVVDLSCNRFYGAVEPQKGIVDQALRAILQLDHVKYVDVTTNALASIDRKDFFHSLSESDLEKLIWIHRPWLLGESWHCLVPEASRDTVIKTHRAYYNMDRE
jgi:hypothetical protein